jgi:ribosomal protein L11 methylase PrmA
MSVLDIGCNAGFHSFEMKKRGAGRVVGIDFDDYYLDQARFAAEVLDLDDIEFRRCRSTTSARWASASTWCCSWAWSTTCGIRCWRWT